MKLIKQVRVVLTTENFHRNQQNTENPSRLQTNRGDTSTFHTACREEAAHYKLYISLVLFSVMEATPDVGEQFRIKLPGVDSSAVQGGRTRDAESEARRERGRRHNR